MHVDGVDGVALAGGIAYIESTQFLEIPQGKLVSLWAQPTGVPSASRNIQSSRLVPPACLERIRPG